MLVKNTRRRKAKRKTLHHRGSVIRKRASGGYSPRPITERDVEDVSDEARRAMGASK